MTPGPPRLVRVAEHDKQSSDVLDRLIGIAERGLPQMYLDGEFVFTLHGERRPDGSWTVRPAGKSMRYGAIAALGLRHLPEPAQRAVLAGETSYDLVGRLAKRLDETASPGDVALLCWAAADTGHADLARILARLRELDRGVAIAQGGATSPTCGYVVDAAWTVSALVAARPYADVEADLSLARGRLLAARSGALYPHVIGGGRWYRAHVGSFADQVYPIQALARLHMSADDPEALEAASAVAAGICAAQGDEGQWWWHYDSRTGEVVEGYPVYSVHQHAMAPMALLDLADAGGPHYLDAICRGVRWLSDPPETGERMALDEPAVTWRKVARKDPRKAVRGLRATFTRIRPGMRIPALDRAFPPGTVDHECRPYELGWLLFVWLS
jgi:hypothetical protein